MKERLDRFEDEIIEYIRDVFDPYEFTTEAEAKDWLEECTLAEIRGFFRE